jgi:hypothetical protein
MNKSEILTKAGNELSCLATCRYPTSFNCFGGWIGSDPICKRGIGNLRENLNSNEISILVMTVRFFGIRVFDATSEKRPLPKIVDIEIKKGHLNVVV